MTSRIQQLKASSLLATLSTSELHQIEREMEERTYRRRQIVYFPEQKNDYIFMLVSGRVKLLKTGASGREVTLDIVSPNELFGEANILKANSPYESSAEVLEDSTILAMRRTSMVAMIMDNIDALREFAALEVSRRHAAEQRLAEFVFYDVPTRLAHLLGQLASFYAQPSSDAAVLIKAKLTHQELANLVGSTRETTTLILNDFKRRKLIEFQGRKIVVLTPSALDSFDSHGASGSPVADMDDPGTIGGRYAGSGDDEDDDDDTASNNDGALSQTRQRLQPTPLIDRDGDSAPKRRGRPRTVQAG